MTVLRAAKAPWSRVGRRWRRAAVVILALLTLPGAVVADAPPAEVPPQLQPWIGWVLDGADQRACALAHDGGGERLCAWPGVLQLDLDAEGGVFDQEWTLQAQQWVPLPGAAGQWPQQVSADIEPVPVVEHAGRPSVQLPAGEHRLTGRFLWSRAPEVLTLPPEIGLVSLRFGGEPAAALRFAQDDGLWLAGRAAPAQTQEPERLTLEVVRRVEDSLPLRVQTRLLLDVAGPAREVLLGPVLLPGGVPLRLESPLPARLMRAGNAGVDTDASPAATFVQVQVRAGRWTLTLDTHHPGPVAALSRPASPAAADARWPEHEIWAFAAQPQLRQVELRGGQPIDPRQTRIPQAWRQLPARLMRPGQTLELITLRRGAQGSDRLQLQRVLRLDFDGAGFSVRDRLSGRIERRGRLDAEPVLQLGQVRVDGEPRLITRLPGDEAPEGIEVRPGRLTLTADAELDTGPVSMPQRVPASGWALPLAGASTELLLPPGWDLLAVGGVDNLPDSWIGRWTLLDIFLVLVAALAVARLWGPVWGLVALLTLVLTWQEPAAPRWVWLHLIAAAALLRLLHSPATDASAQPPPGRGPRWLSGLVRLYFGVALLALALIAVPFLVTEMRDGLFPQLDRDGAGLLALIERPAGGVSARALAPAPRLDERAAPLQVQPVTKQASGLDAARPAAPSTSRSPSALESIDADARLQTGAGVPDWTWRSFQLGWSGPLPAGQRLSLWLLPPLGALLSAVLSLVLVPLLALRLTDRLPRRPRAAQGAVIAVMAVLGGTWSALHPESSQAAPLTAVASAAEQATRGPSSAAQPTGSGFPPAAMLEQLRQRLLAPADCVPRCAEIARMQLDVAGDRLRLVLAVDAAAPVALPIPGERSGWTPSVIRLDGTSLQRLRRASSGELTLPVPRGRHLLQLAGALPETDRLVLPLPLRPRLVVTRLDPGWQLEGVDPKGVPGDQIQLARVPSTAGVGGQRGDTVPGEGAGSDRLPPLLRVTRTLRLGLQWQVETEVRRLSPAAGPVSLRVPLIVGESVNSGDVQVNHDGALVSLAPHQRRMGWRSTLAPVAGLELSASRDSRLSDEWRLAVSPRWHLQAEGVPAVQPASTDPAAMTIYRPWPGEQLHLRLSRPIAVAGPTLTLDHSRYQATPGRRSSEMLLALGLRTSQGGRHALSLPDGAELTALRIDGQPRPLVMQGQTLDLPLVPGQQRIEIGWRAPAGLTWAYRPTVVDLGVTGVNAETRVQLPADRWVLWTSGPGIGPAVQFWAVLLALAALAWLLGRSRQTPLRGVDWLLLGIGLSQVSIWVGALVVLWLFALGWRQRLDMDLAPWRFNLIQVALVLLSIAALVALLVAVEQGLLGAPAMQIAGNGSSATELQWYLDRQPGQTAAVTVVSVPIWVYRALMLAWALWLAWRLLAWLRWGWRSLMSPVPWRSPRRERLERAAADEDLRVEL